MARCPACARALAAAALAALLASCAGAAYRTLPSSAPTAGVPAVSTSVPAAFEARYVAAQTATTLFHVRFDQRTFGRIYAMTDDAFRRTTSEAELTARLAALRERVGASRDDAEVSVEIAERGADLLVTLVMETLFERASLTETFVWRVTPDETTLLVRYETR